MAAFAAALDGVLVLVKKAPNMADVARLRDEDDDEDRHGAPYAPLLCVA